MNGEKLIAFLEKSKVCLCIIKLDKAYEAIAKAEEKSESELKKDTAQHGCEDETWMCLMSS